MIAVLLNCEAVMDIDTDRIDEDLVSFAGR